MLNVPELTCLFFYLHNSLPIPSRDEILNSPVNDIPTTSSYTTPNQRPPSPIMDDPSAELERELANATLGKN